MGLDGSTNGPPVKFPPVKQVHVDNARLKAKLLGIDYDQQSTNRQALIDGALRRGGTELIRKASDVALDPTGKVIDEAASKVPGGKAVREGYKVWHDVRKWVKDKIVDKALDYVEKGVDSLTEWPSQEPSKPPCPPNGDKK